jgi:hypothetical protein
MAARFAAVAGGILVITASAISGAFTYDAIRRDRPLDLQLQIPGVVDLKIKKGSIIAFLYFDHTIRNREDLFPHRDEIIRVLSKYFGVEASCFVVTGMSFTNTAWELSVYRHLEAILDFRKLYELRWQDSHPFSSEEKLQTIMSSIDSDDFCKRAMDLCLEVVAYLKRVRASLLIPFSLPFPFFISPVGATRHFLCRPSL